MLFAHCPFCDTAALVDEAGSTLACDPCAVMLPIEDEPVGVALAAAA